MSYTVLQEGLWSFWFPKCDEKIKSYFYNFAKSTGLNCALQMTSRRTRSRGGWGLSCWYNKANIRRTGRELLAIKECVWVWAAFPAQCVWILCLSFFGFGFLSWLPFSGPQFLNSENWVNYMRLFFCGCWPRWWWGGETMQTTAGWTLEIGRSRGAKPSCATDRLIMCEDLVVWIVLLWSEFMGWSPVPNCIWWEALEEGT